MNKEISNNELAEQITNLAKSVDSKIDNLSKSVDSKIDKLTALMESGFGDLSEAISFVATETGKRFDKLEGRMDKLEIKLDKGFREVKGEVTEIKIRLTKIENDITWIKEILKSQGAIIKNTPEEKILMTRRVDCLEKELILIKKHLKIA